MIKNKATTIPLGDVLNRLGPHIEQMNADGWELMSATVEHIGIQEHLLLFWKRNVPA
jgi:hypothetical protein